MTILNLPSRLILAALLSSIIGAAAWHPAEAVAANRTLGIGFIGDSITAGYGAASPIYAEMNALRDKGITVIPVNSGVSGSTSTNWHPTAGTGILTAALNNFKAKNVSVASIMLGTNDAKAAVNTSTATYKANVQAIASALLAPGTGITRVILNCAPWVSPGNAYSMSSSTIGAYCDQLADLANGTTILQGDTEAFPYFQSHGDRLYDGVHPDDLGTSYLGGLWADALYPYVAAPIAITVGAPTDTTQTSATVHWTSGLASTGKVTYGPSGESGYETAMESSASTEHQATLGNLIPCRQYYYKISATTSIGEAISSSGNTFTTLCPDGAAVQSSAQKNLDPAFGGTLSLKDGSGKGLSLKAAANFDADPLAIQVNKLSQATGVPSGLTVVGGHVYDITAVTPANSLKSDFAGKPFTITVQFSPSSVGGTLDWTKLSMLHNHSGAWEALEGCTIQKLTSSVSCPVSSFSLFALAYAQPAEASYVPASAGRISASPSPTASSLAETGTNPLPFQAVGALALAAWAVLRKRKAGK